MSRVRFDRKTIPKAVAMNREGVRRLARFVRCPSDLSDVALVERLVRKLDSDAMKWPPPKYERDW